MKSLNYPDLPADHPVNKIDKFAFNKGEGKFAAKLTARERCEVLALMTLGMSRNLVAAAYDIDRRTVSHIANPFSKSYKQVRAQMEAKGEKAFIAEFVTSEVMNRVNRAAVERRNEIAATSRRAYEAEKPDPTVPRKQARKDAGMHVVKNDFTSYSHRIEVAWREDQPWGVGWYYRDLDSENPDDWFHNGPESMVTSTLCLAAVRQNLMDD